jgi:hypothetical protein
MTCDLSAVYLRLLTRRLARQCREIVQNGLREDEWLDAEDEFAKLILVGLEEASSQRPADGSLC